MAEWYVLCWIGAFVDAGYYMCPRAMGGESVCRKKSCVLQIQSSTSGSGTYTRHLEKHDTASQTGVGRGTETGVATASTGGLVKFAAPMKQRMADAAVVGVASTTSRTALPRLRECRPLSPPPSKPRPGTALPLHLTLATTSRVPPRSLTPLTAPPLRIVAQTWAQTASLPSRPYAAAVRRQTVGSAHAREGSSMI
jgi:hypothetical protein